MLSDIIKGSSISCSSIPGMTTALYVNASVSEAEVLTAVDTITLPAGTFGIDGDYMEFEYCGSLAGDNDTELFLYFGSDALFHSAVIDPGNEAFTLKGTMVRTGPTSQYTVATLLTSSLQVCTLNSTAITFGPGIDLVLKGIGTSGGAVSLSAAFRRFYFQNR